MLLNGAEKSIAKEEEKETNIRRMEELRSNVDVAPKSGESNQFLAENGADRFYDDLTACIVNEKNRWYTKK